MQRAIKESEEAEKLRTQFEKECGAAFSSTPNPKNSGGGNSNIFGANNRDGNRNAVKNNGAFNRAVDAARKSTASTSGVMHGLNLNRASNAFAGNGASCSGAAASGFNNSGAASSNGNGLAVPGRNAPRGVSPGKRCKLDLLLELSENKPTECSLCNMDGTFEVLPLADPYDLNDDVEVNEPEGEGSGSESDENQNRV